MSGTVPAGTDLQLRYKTAGTPEQLDAAPWSAPHGTGSIPMSPSPGEPCLRVEVSLACHGTVSPSLRSLEVEYGAADAGLAGGEWQIY